MRRSCILFLIASLLVVACERSTETTFTPEIKPPKIAKSSKISISDAIKVAMEGVSMLDDAKTRAQMRVVDPNKTETYVRPATRSGEADTLFYVINFADSAGFAIIAADSAASPQLLAVAESGNYSPNEVGGNDDPWEGWIEDTKGPIRDENGIIIGYPSPFPNPNDPDPLPDFPPFVPDTTITYSDWVTVGPYLEVKWGQEDPYNTYCEDSDSQICPTGCVATALAQILSHYQYPNEDSDALPITFPSATGRSYPNVGNSLLLNWSELKQHVVSLDNTSCSCSETNRTNLAILFRELGQLLDMNYKEEQSDASFGNIINVLTGWGYTCQDHPNYDWDIVRSELDSARLVAMGGERETGITDPAHAWVIDGYKTRTKITNISGKEYTETHNYIHINWGWDGKGNGYYLSGIFDTDQYIELDEGVNKANSKNYDRYLTMITGIKAPILNQD
ncbi:MAG: hypothetical protein E7148_01190 [Rikenellaceae bacterium]|nr:hypothetical protein [Rikenellaceae bacterium]